MNQSSTGSEREYVLGTHDAEVARLALQHRVWRSRAWNAWTRAGFDVGQTLLDVGCGPGHASVDLAELVGPSGRVFAIDQSRRFIDTLEATIRTRGLSQITPVELDLESGALPNIAADALADGAWVRWVFAFLKQPHGLVSRLHTALRPGATLVVHEYFDYSTWQFAPRCPEFDEFVAAVISTWRASGGEPNIGLELPTWLQETGFEVVSLRPYVDPVHPGELRWHWPKSFLDVGLERLVTLGAVTPARAKVIKAAFEERERSGNALQFTPAVLEIVAVRT